MIAPCEVKFKTPGRVAVCTTTGPLASARYRVVVKARPTETRVACWACASALVAAGTLIAATRIAPGGT